MFNKRLVTPLLLGIIILLVSMMIYIFVYGRVVKIDQVYFQKVEISPYAFEFEGGLSDDTLAYARYEVRFKDGVGYLKLRYSLPSEINHDKNFKILKGEYLENIDEFYLVDSVGGRKLIWKK